MLSKLHTNSYPSYLQYKQAVRFSSGSDGAISSFSDHAEGAVEEVLMGLCLKSTVGSFFLSSEDKRKLKSVGMPEEFEIGLRKLNNVRSLNDKDALQEAKILFETAAEKAKLKTLKSSSYRMAAIAAKLRDDNTSAQAFMREAKDCLNNAMSFDRNKIDELDCFVNKVTTAAKGSILSYFVMLEVTAKKIFSDEPIEYKGAYHHTKTGAFFLKTAPFTKALFEQKDNVRDRHYQLRNGYESDDEWVNDNDRKNRGCSTGNGMRHRIPLVEKKRVAQLEQERQERIQQ